MGRGTLLSLEKVPAHATGNSFDSFSWGATPIPQKDLNENPPMEPRYHMMQQYNIKLKRNICILGENSIYLFSTLSVRYICEKLYRPQFLIMVELFFCSI